MKKISYIIMLFFVLLFFTACNTEDTLPLSLEDLEVTAVDHFDIPAGTYTIPYTIEDIETYIETYGIEVIIQVTDQYDQALSVSGDSITVAENKIYTVHIKVLHEGVLVADKIITIESSKTSFSVTYDFNLVLESYVEAVLYGENPEGPSNTPTAEGYVFIGWGLAPNEDQTIDPLTFVIHSNMTFYAIWDEIVSDYSITYYRNDGTDTIFHIDQSVDGFVPVMTLIPTRELYDFIGWTYDPSGEIPLDMTDDVLENISLYAQWAEKAIKLDAPNNVSYVDGIISFDAYETTSAIGYHIFVNDVHAATAFNNSHDISHLLTEAGTYIIEIIAKGDGTLFLDSEKSQAIEIIIDIELELDHFTYTDNGVGLGLTVTGLTEAGMTATMLSNELIIPNRIDGKEVTVIGVEAFKNILSELDGHIIEDEPHTISMFDKVVIPNSVKSIEKDAFFGLMTHELVLSNTLEYIGVGAFISLYGIENLSLPETLKEIGQSAFYGSLTLKHLYIGAYLERIGNNAFEACTELQTISFSASSRLISIGDSSFSSNWSLIELILPHSVETIGNRAFEYNYALFKVNLGNSISFIGGGAFIGCDSLRYVYSGQSQAPVLGDNIVFPANQNISFPSQFQNDSQWAPYFMSS